MFFFLLILKARRTLSDVGMLISIVLMVIVDTVIRSQTGLETPVNLRLFLKTVNYPEN